MSRSFSLRSFTALITLAFLLLASSAHNEENARPRDGYWKPTAAVLSGNKLPDGALDSVTLKITGDKYELKVAGQKGVDRGAVSYDTDATPHRMTITGEEGPNKGKKILAIYEVRNRRSMRVCYDLTGQAYPAKFEAPAGTTHYLVDYRWDGSTPWTWLLSAETKELGQHWRTTGNWTLKDGVATLTPRPGDRGWSRFSDYLWSKEEFGDFEIEFEYKLEKKGNSGFYFRVGDIEDPVKQGIEVQIYDSPSKGPDAKLTDHDAGGIIPGLKPHRRAAKPAGEWNKMRVWHSDKRISVMLNGVNVNAHDLIGGGRLAQRPPKGPIGFQDHALPLSLRNIRIRPVPKDETPRRD